MDEFDQRLAGGCFVGARLSASVVVRVSQPSQGMPIKVREPGDYVNVPGLLVERAAA